MPDNRLLALEIDYLERNPDLDASVRSIVLRALGEGWAARGAFDRTRRKVVQIASCGVKNHIGTQCDWVLHVLCNDGTILERDNMGAPWRPLPPIPPPGEDEHLMVREFPA